MALAAVHSGIAIVKAAGDAVAQLMAQMHPLLNPAVQNLRVHANAAAAPLIHQGHGTGVGQGKAVNRDILLFRKGIEHGNIHDYSFFSASRCRTKAANCFTSSYMASVISPPPPKRANLMSSSVTAGLLFSCSVPHSR